MKVPPAGRLRNLIATVAVAIPLAVCLAFGSKSSAADPAGASPDARELAAHRTLVKRHCLTCHNEKRNTANVNLEVLNFDDVSEHAGLWERVVHKLRTGDMPPPDKRQPSRRARRKFLGWLVTSLDRAADENPNPGRPAVHRLNRSEYANAIRDLFGVEVDVQALLPADGADFGFDNIADSLNMSPLLLERYMMAASKISRLIIGDPRIRPSSKIYQLPKLLRQNERMGEDLPFGSRGGHAVRHHFPADGEYIVKVNIQSPRSDQPLDLYQRSVAPEQLQVRLDGRRVGDFVIGQPEGGKYSYADFQYDNDKQERSDWWGTRTLESRFAVKAGTHRLSVSFLNRTLAFEGVRPESLPAHYTFLGTQRNTEPGIVSFEVMGPYQATGIESLPSRTKLFTIYPKNPEQEDSVAEKLLSAIARRAYRRPLTGDDLETLRSFYEAGYQEGGFESGIKFGLERILVSPKFLFRVEIPPASVLPGESFRLSDLDLASRLSFFLWSSIPDDRLLSIAERGSLRDPGVLEQQVQRMLADERSKALIENFATQWLYLRNVEAVVPDANTFPEFDENLRRALRAETELFVLSQLQQDRPIPELLSANYSFLNERLARHYRIGGVAGSHFRRVDFDDPQRGGLLGHGSILTVTSYATRTSPVRRGKWLLENVLGSPPPPPPADVPDLPEVGSAGENATMRQRMEAHLKDPTCASCHVKMDPLGFALENFDAIGKWRTHEAGLPVDAMGQLADGTVIDGPSKLREVLLETQDEFVRTVTQKLLVYALGRGIEYYDQPTVRDIMRRTEQDRYRWSSVIVEIVKSTPFQQRATRPKSR